MPSKENVKDRSWRPELTEMSAGTPTESVGQILPLTSPADRLPRPVSRTVCRPGTRYGRLALGDSNMSVKPDFWIRQMATDAGMIEPFEEGQVSRGSISYGVSSYGYDFRLGTTFKVPAEANDRLLDPKNPAANRFADLEAPHYDIPPRTYVLGQSLEYFRIPRDILTICTGKSTYARCGVVVNVTPFEPEWEGFATLSISNTGPSPVRLYGGEGIAQLIFLEAAAVCETSYGDRKGKYQAQQRIVVSRVSS